MDELTPRQERILTTIVRDYVSSVVPVSSDRVLQDLGLAISSATVRNDMAVLEELGYIMHPHTSAGRVPTIKGYRYFVERLMGQAELPLTERLTIQHQFHQVEGDQDQWLRLAASILARSLPSAALVIPPKLAQCHLKQLQLVSIHETVVLLVVVLQEGTLKQAILTVSEPAVQESLTSAANKLNARFCGKAHDSIEINLEGLTTLERLAAETTARIMRAVDDQVGEEVFHSGLHNILAEPEFGDVELARPVVEALEQGTVLSMSLGRMMEKDAVTVIIGGESIGDEMRMCSLVLSRYGIPGQMFGILGVIGPTRMPYWRALPSVRYMSSIVSTLLQEMYG
jgi:heat-inducible transcriptional repressor